MKKTKQVLAPAPSGKVAKQRAARPKINANGIPDYETYGDIRAPRGKKMNQNVPAIQQKKMTFGDQEGSLSWRVFRIMSEYIDGFEFLSKLERTITFFGSAR